LCATTGWHRNHARKSLKAALQPKVVKPGTPRPVKYGPNVIAALTICWHVLGMPAGKRLAPILGELVAVLRRFGELVIDDDTADLLVSMSAEPVTIETQVTQQVKVKPEGQDAEECAITGRLDRCGAAANAEIHALTAILKTRVVSAPKAPLALM